MAAVNAPRSTGSMKHFFGQENEIMVPSSMMIYYSNKVTSIELSTNPSQPLPISVVTRIEFVGVICFAFFCFFFSSWFCVINSCRLWPLWIRGVHQLVDSIDPGEWTGKTCSTTPLIHGRTVECIAMLLSIQWRTGAGLRLQLPESHKQSATGQLC